MDGQFRFRAISVHNFQRIEVVELKDLDENYVEIQGQNEQGKSSLLNSMQALIDSGRSKDAPKDPVRHGCDSAVIRAELTDRGQPGLVATKSYNAKGKADLDLWNDSTHTPIKKSPQNYLSELMSPVTIDVSRLMRMQPNEIADLMLDILGIRDELAEFATKHTEAKERRKGHNAEVTRLMTNFGNLTESTEKLPDEPVDVRELQAQRTRSEDAQKARDDKQAEIDTRLKNYLAFTRANTDDREEITRLEDKIKELQSGIADRERAQKSLVSEGQALRVELGAMPEPDDVEAIDDQILNASDTNEAIRNRDLYQKGQDDLRAAHKLVSAEQKIMDEIDAARIKMITEADYPIEGIRYDADHGLLVDEVPFGELTGSGPIKVSLAIGIALQPHIRVLFIRDGSLLDASARAEIEQIARDEDFQVIVEIVVDDAKTGIVIEAGKVKEQ